MKKNKMIQYCTIVLTICLIGLIFIPNIGGINEESDFSIEDKVKFPIASQDSKRSNASEVLCQFSINGDGILPVTTAFPRHYPNFLFPGPRMYISWNVSGRYTSTYCYGLSSGNHFFADGAQQGYAIGFFGFGSTGADLYGYKNWGVQGIALYCYVEADEIS